MQIKLKWTNRNIQPVVTRIYRTTAIVPNDQLGAHLVELDGAILEWMDLTAVRGTTYYYVFATIGGGQTLYSNPLKVVADYSTGPGPDVLARGDQSLGYYGQIAAIDFFTATEVQIAGGFTPNAVATPLPMWDKWVRNGKILYVPRTNLYLNASWDQYYSQGLVFGVNNDGPWKAPAAPAKNQLKTIDKGFNRFIIRLPTAADDRNNPTRVVADAAPVSIRKYSEVADLFYPMMSNYMPDTQRFPRVPGVGTFAAFTEGRALAAQEKYLTGTLEACPASISSRDSQQALVSRVTASTSPGWKPVLELIQDDLIIVEA